MEVLYFLVQSIHAFRREHFKKGRREASLFNQTISYFFTAYKRLHQAEQELFEALEANSLGCTI